MAVLLTEKWNTGRGTVLRIPKKKGNKEEKK